MDSEKMNPARFADSLDIGRAVISHILNGRNNPSLDVITRILKHMPNIDPEWLLTGKGSMYKNEFADNNIKDENLSFPNLFSQLTAENVISETKVKDSQKYQKENTVNTIEKTSQASNIELLTKQNSNIRKIKQIIIYYNDNTFETFSGDK